MKPVTKLIIAAVLIGIFILIYPQLHGLFVLSSIFIKALFHKEINGDKWKEEVLLQDGSVITVQQVITGKERVAAFERYFKLKSYSLEVIDAQNMPLPPRWEDKWQPVLIDHNPQGEWYLIVAPTRCFDWHSTFPYREYKAVDGSWQRTEFDMALEGRIANLLWRPLIGHMPEFVKLEDKPYGGRDAYKVLIEFREISPSAYSYCP